MYAFNKRHRETTYVGIKVKPLFSGIFALMMFLMFLMTMFSAKGVGFISFILLIACVLSIAYLVYEVKNSEDWRIRLMRSRSRRLINTKQAML